MFALIIVLLLAVVAAAVVSKAKKKAQVSGDALDVEGEKKKTTTPLVHRSIQFFVKLFPTHLL